MQAASPAQTMTKGPSRRKHTLLYHLDRADNTRVQVCPKVFLETLQITRKFVRYAWENAEQGFCKPDQRGKHTVPKHKITQEQKQQVLKHLDSFTKIEAHVRKCSKKIYIEDTSNFSRLTVAFMDKLYVKECTNSVGIDTYRKIFND